MAKPLPKCSTEHVKLCFFAMLANVAIPETEPGHDSCCGDDPAPISRSFEKAWLSHMKTYRTDSYTNAQFL